MDAPQSADAGRGGSGYKEYELKAGRNNKKNMVRGLDPNIFP
jgi:hypothetical protein